MNNWVGTGRLARDPELKSVGSGIEMCDFTIAVNRRFKNKETNQYEADFIPCTAWRQGAKFVASYFKKGDMIAVVGTLQTRKYEDKETGKKRTAFGIQVDNVEFCGGKNQGGQSTTDDGGIPEPASSNYATASAAAIVDTDDLPF